MKIEYPKIPGPFKRNPVDNKLLPGEWTSDELALLANVNDWIFTEKVDGTNVRIFWDGYRVTWAGRTDTSTFSAETTAALERLVGGHDNETLFEQKFGDTPATLYGELYGPKIQSGGIYRNDITFALFDIRIGGFWLNRAAVEDIGPALGLEVVPLVLDGVNIQMAIDHVTVGLLSEVTLDDKAQIFAEGLVGTTRTGLLDRAGRRIIVKVKHRDFYQG